MTFTSPIGYGFPGYGCAYTDVQPFTYRAGVTYTDLLESLRSYVTDTLAPHVDESFTAVEGDAKAIGAALEVQFQDAINDVELHAYGFTPLQGIGIDLTGATDSTAAVQAFAASLPNGATVVVPAEATILLSDTIFFPYRVTLSGSGELRWASGVSDRPGITLNGDGSKVDGIRMVNAGSSPSTGANKQYGIRIQASNVSVANSTIDGFQQGIAVLNDGEFYGAVITGNQVLNVPGSGMEDRGDGIAVWGAECTVAGNRVTAAVGADARIGISAEGLPTTFSRGAGFHPDALIVLANNTVSGTFRRGIASEEIVGATITGNTVADSTWWGIAIIGSDAHVVSGNSITWTLTAASGTPNAAAIMVYGNGANNIITDNTVTCAPASRLPYGIYAVTVGDGPVGTQTGLRIAGNTLRDGGVTMNTGIYLNGGVAPIEHAIIEGNTIAGVNVNGIYSWNCSYPVIRGNTVNGESDRRARGIFIEGSSEGARCDGNSIYSASTGIGIINRFVASTVQGNLLFSCAKGLDHFGTTPPDGGIANNVYVDCVTDFTPA